MGNVIGYYQAAQSMLNAGKKLVGKSKSGIEVYNVGDNVIASLKNGQLFKVIARDAEKKQSTVFDFEKQMVINTKRAGEKTGGLSKTIEDMYSGEILGKLKMFYDKRGITKVNAQTPEGNMYGLTYFNKLMRRFNYRTGGQGQFKGYSEGLKDFFNEFRTRVCGEKKVGASVKAAASKEPVYINVTEMLGKTQDKLKRYMSVVSENSKLTKPVIINHEGIQTGFTIDKTQAGRTRLIIKAGDNLKDWNNESGVEILQAIVDKKGQMIEGSLTGFNGTFNFVRNAKNIRRIEFGGEEFLPVGNTPKSWASKVGSKAQTRTLETTINNHTNLGDLFLEWAGLKSTVI